MIRLVKLAVLIIGLGFSLDYFFSSPTKVLVLIIIHVSWLLPVPGLCFNWPSWIIRFHRNWAQSRMHVYARELIPNRFDSFPLLDFFCELSLLVQTLHVRRVS